VVILPGAVPPPSPPQIVGLQLVVGDEPPRIRFTWKSETGRQYRVQRAPSLNGPWQDLAFTISGTGDFIEFSDACAGDSCGFYRIRLVNPVGSAALQPAASEPPPEGSRSAECRDPEQEECTAACRPVGTLPLPTGGQSGEKETASASPEP